MPIPPEARAQQLPTWKPILLFTPTNGISPAFSWKLQKLAESVDIPFHCITMTSIHELVPEAVKPTKRGKSTTWVVNKKKLEEITQAIRLFCERFQPEMLIVNDPAVLAVIAGQIFSVNEARGSVFHWHWNAGEKGIPCIVLDNVENMRRQNHGEFVAMHDWAKIGRWYHGTQRAEPKFNYVVCRTKGDLDNAREFLTTSAIMSVDSETIDDWITLVGYCGMREGVIRAYVIPFWNPLHSKGLAWEDKDLGIYALTEPSLLLLLCFYSCPG